MAKSKRILVAGGAGFIGSHLCAKLLDLGNEVICVDNFFSGAKNNILPMQGHPHFEVIRHDICEPLSLEVDVIYNLACPASPVHYQFDPVKTVQTSIHGSINLLELAKRRKARIFLASTSEVYGDPEIHPQHEEYCGSVNPIGPRACYDEGKRCAETLFFSYYREHQMDIKIARFFNTYGPQMTLNDGRVVTNFIIQALTNEPIIIHGNGSQTRSFCYIDDLIDGIVKFMKTPDTFTGPMNLGNTEELTISELADMVIDLTGSRSKKALVDAPENDPKQRCPNIDLALKTLDWKPSIPLREGLLRTIAYLEGMLRDMK